MRLFEEQNNLNKEENLITESKNNHSERTNIRYDRQLMNFSEKKEQMIFWRLRWYKAIGFRRKMKSLAHMYEMFMLPGKQFHPLQCNCPLHRWKLFKLRSCVRIPSKII